MFALLSTPYTFIFLIELSILYKHNETFLNQTSKAIQFVTTMLLSRIMDQSNAEDTLPDTDPQKNKEATR